MVVWSVHLQFKLVMVEEDFEDEYINIHVQVFENRSEVSDEGTMLCMG